MRPEPLLTWLYCWWFRSTHMQLCFQSISDPGKSQACSWLMNSAKTLKFSSQCVNKHSRAGLAMYTLMRKDPKNLFTFLKPRSQNYCSGWLKVSPWITAGIGNIWLPDFCPPQPLQMSLKPTFICCTTNQHGFGLSVLAMQDHQVCDIEGKLNKQLSLPFSATVSEGTQERQWISEKKKERQDRK